MFCCLTIHCYAPTLKASLSIIIYFLGNDSFFLLINGDFNLKSRFKPSSVSSMTILSNIRCRFALLMLLSAMMSSSSSMECLRIDFRSLIVLSRFSISLISFFNFSMPSRLASIILSYPMTKFTASASTAECTQNSLKRTDLAFIR